MININSHISGYQRPMNMSFKELLQALEVGHHGSFNRETFYYLLVASIRVGTFFNVSPFTTYGAKLG